MKQKCIHLSEEDVTLLNSIKKKYGFKSDGQTVSYLIHKHEQGFEELAVAVRKELEDKLDMIDYAYDPAVNQFV